MSYKDTARAFAQAESNNHAAHGGQAAEKLAMSEWAESRRDLMTPQTIAENHALHVRGCAAVLRDALTCVTEDTTSSGYEIADRVAYAARALLAVIGEGE